MPIGSVLGPFVFSSQAHSLDEYKWLLSIFSWISNHLKLDLSFSPNKSLPPLVSLITVNSIFIIPVVPMKRII